MSKTITLKRIALVAVSALGFGLMSAIPASAGQVDAITTASLAPTAGASDPTIDVTLGGSGREITAEVRSATGTISLADLTLTVTGTVAGGPDDYMIVVTTDDISAGAADDYSAKEVAQANVTGAAFAAVTLDGLATTSAATKLSGGVTHGTPDTIGVGTYYVNVTVANMNLAASAAQSANTGGGPTDVLITMTVSQSAMVVATLDTATTSYAGRVGQEVSITPTAAITTLAASLTTHPRLRVSAALTGQPAVPSGQNIVRPKINAVTTLDSDLAYASAGNVIDDTAESVNTNSTADATNPATINYSGLSNKGITTAANKALGTITFTPVATGVYTLVVWNESSTSGTPALSGAESFQTFTINVVSDVTTIALAAINSTAKVDASGKGALIKVTLKDAGGNLAIPATGQSIVLTPSGSALIKEVNDVGVTSAAGAAYNLSASDFAQSGVAYVNIANGTAETVTITATYAGSASASVSLTFRTVTAPADTAPTPYSATASGYVHSGTTTGTTSIPIGTVTTTYVLGSPYSDTTASYVGFSVTDTLGTITGVAGLDWVAAATVGTTSIAAYSITATTSAATASIYTVTSLPTGQTRVSTASSVATTTGTLTASPTTVNAVAGATNKIKVSLLDNFSRALANTTVTASVTGRNPTTVAKTAVTDSLGNASFSFTDANTTSVIASDTITLTPSGGTAITVTILYGAANAPSTITLTSTGDTDVIAGTTTTDIDASYAGATGTSATASAVVKNSAGSAIAGVPVTFTVTGLVGAEVHTTKVTVYTDTTGKAVSAISSYAAGKATVTATAGTATASDDIYFSQKTPGEARTIAASATGGLVTATVKDRYGNVIKGVTVNASRTGSGYFGNGASTATGLTDKDGQVEFNFTGTGTVTVGFDGKTYGQSYAAAGYDVDAVNGTAITAYTAGTDAEDQEGLGGSLSPAGINSVSVAVSAADAGVTAAEAATDAAAEAIDAANAATDAANLAAEAADAATVAAEEARDAADAATAAVAELATQVATLMAALKAQVTTLAATVAKIAKKLKA